MSSKFKVNCFPNPTQEISRLVNETQHEGEYIVRFDGSDLPAGIYLARLQACSLVETVKVVVMR